TSAGGLAFQVSLDGSPYAPAASPVSYTNLGEGSHTFSVRATDQAGNTSEPATYPWTIDVTPPTASITSQPPRTTNSSMASFGCNGSDAVTVASSLAFQVTLDGTTFVAATSPVSYTNLGEGSHTFSVKAIDQAGNASEPVTYSWTIDVTQPTASITSQ